ncbi:MAG: isoprenyl transferase [Bacillota bacterium]
MSIPNHVAIIMDGNGRWAQYNGIPRREGHKKGVKTLKNIVKHAAKSDINFLTVYAFSTENWKRPKTEVNFLMKLMKKTMRDETQELIDNGVKVNFLGRKDDLPSQLIKEIELVEEKSKNNTKLTLNIAFNYGGRAEIIDTVKKICTQSAKNEDQLNKISEHIFESNLYVPELPDVDLLIRTGGDKRISNFLLWQLAYAELYFTDKYWPDFTEKDLDEAIEDFKNRDRRFGGLKNDGDL